MALIFNLLLLIIQSATPDSDPVALEIYDGREIQIFLNVWNTREHAPQIGEGDEYAEDFEATISRLLGMNETRVAVSDVTLCFDLEIDASNCQKVYNSNPNVTIPWQPLSAPDKTHWSILLTFSFLPGPDRTPSYYALYLQNGIRDRTSYVYDGEDSPFPIEHGRVEYYTMSPVGSYFFQGPEDPEICSSGQTSTISECTLMTTVSECSTNSNCYWSSSCPSFSPPVVSVPNCLPFVHCIHSSIHTDYTITYQDNSCPYLTQPEESPESDWGKDLANDVESFFENPYLVILIFILFLFCVSVCLYWCVRRRTKRKLKKVARYEKNKIRDHSPRRHEKSPRQFYPPGPSTVVTESYRSEGRAPPTYSYVADTHLGPTPGRHGVQNYPHSVASFSSYAPQIHHSSKRNDSYV